MKLLRSLLIVLLAVLLPWRGAVAAVMMCEIGGHGGHGTAAMHVETDGAHHPHHAAEPAGKAVGSHCAAFCCATVLPHEALGVPASPGVAATRFPPLTAPACHAASGGQDRPPRSP